MKLTSTSRMLVPCGLKPLDYYQLIQSRVDEIVRPNLDKVTLKQLGDLPWISTEYRGSITLADSLSVEGRESLKDVLSEQGIFALYDNPTGHLGELATRIGWGLNRRARWVCVQATVLKNRTSRGWCEQLVELKLTELSLRELLKRMEQSQRGEYSQSWFWTYTDDDGVWHAARAHPLVIWSTLGDYVRDWHKKQRERYFRSRRFVRQIEIEDTLIDQVLGVQ